MPTLRDIQRRIRSVQSTQKITRAMKLVAAAKLRRAQERVVAARPYAGKMAELLGHLVSGSDGAAHPLLERREGPRRQIAIITADKGLAGAFNSNVIRRSLELVRAASRADVTLVVVGRKARDFYRRRRDWTIKRDMVGFWDRLAFAHAAELADFFMQQYLDGEVDEVHLIYNEFRSVTVQRPVHEQLLPIPRAAGQADAAPVEYIYEPSPAAILGDLLPRHVRTQVYRALMESLAGEYGARMTAMEAATKNAKEMIEVLTIQYNKARQEKIT
ncbi:MAG TPA: ATP synthase F1 subunit gamma, partial [Methylomirabilota bacterium]|nr:ATP synthase F1 subunit gamma [Methylomirabilota bacterium]